MVFSSSKFNLVFLLILIFVSNFRRELNTLRGIFVIRGVLLSFNIVSRFSIFLSLASYVYFGNIFTSRQVFIVTSYFNFLYDSMLLFWPIAITTTAECFVSMKRVEEFLLLPEDKIAQQTTPYRKSRLLSLNPSDFLSNTKRKMSKPLPVIPDVLINNNNNNFEAPTSIPIVKRVNVDEMSHEKCVTFKNVTAMWRKDSPSGIENIDLEIMEKQFCAIIGPVGSGKSTILHTILRELEIDAGELTVNGVVSYAAQEPWLFEATVRQNILFTEKYDEMRYKQTIQACALERDLQLLPYGDYTIIGERGICLSGGQRARINLARAIYRKADIYLLDDPLSAVDTVVGKHIFDNCIKNFLGDKICILVTHQEQYLKTSKHVVVMSSGKIQIQGSFSRIKNVNQSFRQFTSSKTSLGEDNKLDDVMQSQVSNFILFCFYRKRFILLYLSIQIQCLLL